MADWARYTTGLHRVSDRSYAYMQPDGSWGLNNTAFLIGGAETLMIDTGCDIRTTEAMLAAIAQAEPAARAVGTVLLTHWHVDHVHGINVKALREKRIVASKTCAEYMANLPPQRWLAAIDSLQGDAKRQIEH